MPNIWDNRARKRGVVFVSLGLVAALSLTVSLYIFHESEDGVQAVALGQGDTLAAKYMNGMRAELISFSRKHPILQGIEQDNVANLTAQPPNVCSLFDCEKAKLLRDASCHLYFARNTVRKDYPQFSLSEPTSNGICLSSIVSTSRYFAVTTYILVDEHWGLQNGRNELHISYKLELGENLKRLDAPIRKILRRYLKALRDDIFKQGEWVEMEHTQRR
ncbi:MAG: hypothetical protein HZA88_07205 [Verrucomicrobia bacterium]|nr:hypothetical protein [Verrucomicrobiota bacterium]